MRPLLAWIDLANVCYALGALCVAVTVYTLWPVWTPAFVGGAFIVAGIARDLGKKGGSTNGPPR